MSRGEAVFLALLGMVGVGWILHALQLPYQNDFVPASGFFPLWIAVVLVGLVLLLLVAQRRSTARIAAAPMPRRPALVFLALAVCVALIDVVGFAFAVAGLVAFLVGCVERSSGRVTLASAVAIPAVIILVFRGLLSIPLPQGPWGF